MANEASSISPALLQEITSAREQLLRSALTLPGARYVPTIPLPPDPDQPDRGDADSSSSSLDPDPSPDISTVELPKVVIEYPVPAARDQTQYEIATVGDNMLVLTQQSNTHLVKILLSPTTGRPLACASFIVGDLEAGLQGLCTSQIYKNQVWVSALQNKTEVGVSLLLRIKPGLSMDCMPVVMQKIPLPPSVGGPQCVYECGPDLWTGCKDIISPVSHMVRVKHSNPCTDYSVYPCSGRPICIARHPTSRDMYANLDSRSKIWRLKSMSGSEYNREPVEIDIPSRYNGSTPGGLVAGTDGNIWFTLLGGRSGGTGTFARILHTGEFQWFSLTTPVATDAGLIHLAFDWHAYFQWFSLTTPVAADCNESTSSRPASEGSDKNDGKLHHRVGSGPGTDHNIHRLWLLSTTAVADAGHSIDAVFSVLVNTRLGRIIKEQSIALPTPRCVTHRVLPHRTGLFVTELNNSSLAHIMGAAALKVEDVEGETTDFYHNVGLGQDSPRFTFELAQSPPCPPGPLPPPLIIGK